MIHANIREGTTNTSASTKTAGGLAMQAINQTFSVNAAAAYATLGAMLRGSQGDLGIPLKGKPTVTISVVYGGRAYTDLTVDLGIDLSKEIKLLLLQGIRDEFGSDASMELFINGDMGLIRHWLTNRVSEIEGLTCYQAGRFLASGSIDPLEFAEVAQ